MTRMILSSLLCCLFTSTAFAQPIQTDEYEGKWTAVIRKGQADERVGRLVVKNYAGTWLEVGTKGAKSNPCMSKKAFPITVQESTKEEFEFTVWSASVLPSSCPDLGMSLKPIDAKTLEGTTAQGDPIRLTRR